MPEPGGEEIIAEPSKTSVMCARCNTEMQQIGEHTYKCPKCGLTYKKEE